MRILDGGVGAVSALAFSPDGRFLAVGGTSRVLDVWDPSDGGLVHRLNVAGPVYQFQFHPHRPAAYAVVGHSVCELSHDGGRVAVVREIRPLSSRLDLSADGRRLVVSGRFDMAVNGVRLAVFDTAGDGPPDPVWADPLIGDGTMHSGLAWLPGADQFVVSEWVENYPNYAERIIRREGTTGAVIDTSRTGTRRRGSWTHPDGTTGTVLDTLPGRGSPTVALAVAPDGTLVEVSKTALAAWPGGDTSRDPRLLRNDTRKYFTGAAFHPSGRSLAAVGNDGTVKIIDTAGWGISRTYA